MRCVLVLVLVVVVEEGDMASRPRTDDETMLDTVARAISKADGGSFEQDRDRYRHLALAAVRSLARPTKGMIIAAHAAVEFDAMWAINSNRDFARAVKAMMGAVANEIDLALGRGDDPVEVYRSTDERQR